MIPSISDDQAHRRKGRFQNAVGRARLAFRALVKWLLRGARFVKNELHAIFERQGGYEALSQLYDEAIEGKSGDARHFAMMGG